MTMKLAVVTLTIIDDEDDSPMVTVAETIGLPTRFTRLTLDAEITQDPNFREVRVINVSLGVEDNTAYYEGNK